MSSIFQNAFISLAATHAANVDDGLFNELPITSKAREFKTYNWGGITNKIQPYAQERHCCQHNPLILLLF
jgi:hypothetical protein